MDTHRLNTCGHAIRQHDTKQPERCRRLVNLLISPNVHKHLWGPSVWWDLNSFLFRSSAWTLCRWHQTLHIATTTLSTSEEPIKILVQAVGPLFYIPTMSWITKVKQSPRKNCGCPMNPEPRAKLERTFASRQTMFWLPRFVSTLSCVIKTLKKPQL